MFRVHTSNAVYITFVRNNILTSEKQDWFGLVWFNPLQCFFGSEGHVALDRNPGPGYDTLFLRMIPGDLLSAFPHRQFNTLPGLLDSWAALPNSNPNACMPMRQGGSLYYFYDGLWYDPAERRTHDLPCERRTRYRLSQPNRIEIIVFFLNALCPFALFFQNALYPSGYQGAMLHKMHFFPKY